MSMGWIKTAIAAGLLTAGSLPAETLYEQDGITLEGSVRLVHRAAATCQVLAENESPETYEATKANHGQPLHVWRLDYGALNASGKALSNLTAHFQIEAEWPPCTNWTGLGQFPGPVQWASSFETIQRTGSSRGSATGRSISSSAQLPRQPRRRCGPLHRGQSRGYRERSRLSVREAKERKIAGNRSPHRRAATSGTPDSIRISR
ncbi:MAG: hypothetical protein OXC19_03575 [Bryobacterales bacterium]|nr:hypothetical protein [Bryobacterales bacterium]